MEKTQRGFNFVEFFDFNETRCKIQKSSLATEDAIWFGAQDIGLKELRRGEGWKDVPLESSDDHAFIANNLMHLTREQVKKLLPVLKRFVETGEVEEVR